MQRRMVGVMVLMTGFIFALVLGDGEAQTAVDKAAGFYKGKTITWVVSAVPGGSTDVIARILVPHVGRETGSKIVVKNMTGGSLEGDNWTFNEAKRDGLTLLTENTNALILNDLLRSPGVRYETEKFIFLAGVVPELCVGAASPKLPYRTLDALLKAKGLKAGASSARGNIAVSEAVSIAVLGLDARVVTGYKGMKSVLLAVSQGEMDMVIASEPDIALAAKNGEVVPLFIVGEERSALMPNIPTIKELGVAVPQELRDAYRTIAANSGRAMALPPGVPAENVAYLRRIFKKMSETKAVQDDLNRYTGISRPFISGEKLQSDIATIKANKELANQMEGIIKKYSATR